MIVGGPSMTIPETQNALVLRTDFSDDLAWERICAAIRAPVGDFQAYVDCLSDRNSEGVTEQNLPEIVSTFSRHRFIVLVDEMALRHPEHPVLAVDLRHEPGRNFRIIPSEMWGLENNLSIANMDFFEFADNVDPDGIFRGF